MNMGTIFLGRYICDGTSYKLALAGEFLINEHDWDEENQDFKNEAENRFGANWKQEVSRSISWIGLEETSDYLTYRNSYDGFQFLYITTIRSKIANTNKNCQ